MLGPLLRGASKKDATSDARAWIERVGLRGLNERYPSQLSGGQRKRVAMAQALINRLPILLMDESFSALDVQTRALMENELLELWQELGATVLFVTHDLEEAIAMSDRVLLFTAGPDATLKGDYPVRLPRPRARRRAGPERDRADVEANRQFKGVGPTLSWEAARRLLGDEQMGHLDLDWSLTGGVLFGKQKTSLSGTYEVSYSNGKYQGPTYLPPLTPTPLSIAPRTKSVSVPMLDLSLGLAYEIQRVKVGAGYRWERYYNVLDGGNAEHKEYDRTIDGPYFKIAVGFGG